MVLLTGEPGIGKSRLVRALRGRLENEAHTALSHYCSPHHQTSPLYPVIGLLKRAAGFAADDHAAARLDKLEALLALSTDDVTGVAPLLAALLSLKTDARYPPLDMSPHRQKERTLEELVDQVLGLAMRRPVLALYEDVHWADRIDSINATRHRRDVGSWPILLKKSKMLPTQNTRKSLLAADFF